MVVVAAVAAVVAAAAVAEVAERVVRVRRARSDALLIHAASPTLNGNIALRAAQACVPFVQGNSLGFVLSLPSPMRISRGPWGSLHCDTPRVALRTDASGDVAVSIETGLIFEDPTDARWLLDRAYNRHDRRIRMAPLRIVTGEPLVLTFTLGRAELAEPIVLAGPLASVSLEPLQSRWSIASESQRDAMRERHEAFFDQAYFDAKRQCPTRKYRSQSNDPHAPLVEPDTADAVVHALQPHVVSARQGPAEGLSLVSECAVQCLCFGAATQASVAPAGVAQRMKSLARYDSEGAPTPASLYLARYAVGHSEGDPHVLIKPSVHIATRRDWVLVICGPSAVTHSVLRGVIDTQWFHSVPVVLSLHRERAHIVPATELAWVRAMPRDLCAPTLQIIT